MALALDSGERAGGRIHRGVDALVRKPRVAALLRLGPIAALVVVATFAGPRRPPAPGVRARPASGNVELADSRGGDAIVSADDMQPGRSVSGTVTIRNSGDAAAAL